MSRTRPARSENSADSRAGEPKSFTSSAPETLKRSVMVVFIDALRSNPSRVIACSRRPTRLAGTTKTGRITTPSSVRRHSRASIAARVVPSTMTLETTEPRVVVTARCAPMTSLFTRLISAPVWVRVKKARGMAEMWSNSATRRSKITPSPMRAEYHRSTNDSTAPASAAATMIRARVVSIPRLPWGMAVSMIRGSSRGATSSSTAAMAVTTTNMAIAPQ